MSRELNDNRFLADLFTKDSVQASFLQEIVRSINNVARGAGVAVSGDNLAPPPVNAITIKASGEQIHAVLSHSAQVTRSINYFLEADTSEGFTQPHVMDIGASRSHVFMLPTLNDSGAIQPWYLRAYAQYPGSPPSKPTVYGGLTGPTAITLQGTTKMTLLPSTGSGTASSTGQQGGAGRGRQRVSTPKVVRIGKSQASQTPVVAASIASAVHLLAAVASASQSTSLAQNGTSTAINVGNGTFYLGDLTINTFAGSVNPGAYGTYYVYHDDPNLQGGNVVYQATTDVTMLARGFGRFYDGSITTTSGGGGSGGGHGGGSGRGPLLP